MFEGASFATEKAKELVASTGGVLSKARSIVSGDALFFSVAPKIDDLRFALAADSVYDKRDGMKRITAQMCKGADMHALFPDVVKNIHVPSTELRKLIYLFVVHYAESCPNEALLSISAFQKDLVNPSMHVRSLALRMLSAMQIPAIHPVVMLAVKKCAADSAPIVRKTAAIALFQMCCVSRQETDMASLYATLRVLLDDKNAEVVSAAVMAFEHVCRKRYDLLHPVYRHLCGMLPDCEEWGQDVLLRVLVRYARDQFCDPTKPHGGNLRDSGSKSFSSASGSSSSGSSSSSSDDDDGDYAAFVNSKSKKKRNATGHHQLTNEVPLDPDHQLLLTAAKPLLFSLSSSVVVGVCALYLHCAPPRYLDYCVKPLMRVLRSATEGHGIILNTIHSLLGKCAQAFAPYIKEFYLLSQDSADVRALKHRILSQLAIKDNLLDLFQEYKGYVRGLDAQSVAEAVRGLGLIVAQHSNFSALTMRLLTPLLTHGSPATLTEAVAVLRLLVVQGKGSHGSVKLVFKLMQDAVEESITAAPAVAMILWLVGESLRLHPAMAAAAPECFRVFVQRFSSLEPAVKQEVLTLGCKVWLVLDDAGAMAERFRGVFFYALELARYDEDYLIRDHARLLECACERNGDAFTAIKACLEGEKPPPHVVDPYAVRSQFELGTFSNYFGVPMFAYEELPPWRSEAPDAALRRPARTSSAEDGLWSESGNSAGRHGRGGASKANGRKAATWSSSSSSSSFYSSSRSPSSSSRPRENAEGGNFYSEASSSSGDEGEESGSGSGSGTSSEAGSGHTSDSGASERAIPTSSRPPAAKPITIKTVIPLPPPRGA